MLFIFGNLSEQAVAACWRAFDSVGGSVPPPEDAILDGLEPWMREVLTRCGWPFGRHSRPPLRYSPTSKHSVYRWGGESRGAHRWRRKSRVSG